MEGEKSQSSFRKHLFYEVKAKLHTFCCLFERLIYLTGKGYRGKEFTNDWSETMRGRKRRMAESGNKSETAPCCGGVWTAPAGRLSHQGLMAVASSR